jgi:hypothetical protein
MMMFIMLMAIIMDDDGDYFDDIDVYEVEDGDYYG